MGLANGQCAWNCSVASVYATLSTWTGTNCGGRSVVLLQAQHVRVIGIFQPESGWQHLLGQANAVLALEHRCSTTLGCALLTAACCHCHCILAAPAAITTS